MTTETLSPCAPSVGIKIRADHLAASLRSAVSILPARGKPIENFALLESTLTEGATIRASSPDRSIRLRVTGSNCPSEPFATLLSRDRCLAILSLHGDEECVVSRDQATDSTLFKFTHASYNMNSQSPDDFPEAPAASSGPGFIASGPELARAIESTYRICEESQRYALGGCLVEVDGQEGVSRLIATDGRRIGIATFCGVPAPGAPLVGTPVIPARALKIAAGLFGADGVVNVTFTPAGEGFFSEAVFSAEGKEFRSTLVAGRFPPWRNIIPEHSPRLAVRPDLLLAALTGASATLTEVTTGVEIGARDGVWTVRTQCGSMESTFDAPEGSEPITLAPWVCSHEYLAEPLRALAKGDECKIQAPVAKGSAAGIFTERLTYYVMPVTPGR